MAAGRTLSPNPIGHVAVDRGTFTLRIAPPYRAALRGPEGFSHADVLFWCDQVDTDELRRVLLCPKPYKKAPAELGVFATRSPVRPNPIALTPVELLQIDIDEGFVRVPYLDAEDNSPILDIKPYHPCTDRIREVRVPEWCAHWPKWYEDSGDFAWQDEFVSAE